MMRHVTQKECFRYLFQRSLGERTTPKLTRIMEWPASQLKNYRRERGGITYNDRISVAMCDNHISSIRASRRDQIQIDISNPESVRKGRSHHYNEYLHCRDSLSWPSNVSEVSRCQRKSFRHLVHKRCFERDEVTGKTVLVQILKSEKREFITALPNIDEKTSSESDKMVTKS